MAQLPKERASSCRIGSAPTSARPLTGRWRRMERRRGEGAVVQVGTIGRCCVDLESGWAQGWVHGRGLSVISSVGSSRSMEVLGSSD
jgi:hypothetical protein